MVFFSLFQIDRFDFFMLTKFVFWLICFCFLSIHSWFILGEFYSSTNNYYNTSFFSIFPSNIYLGGSSPRRKRSLVHEFGNFLKQWKISTKVLGGNIFQQLLQSHGFYPFFILFSLQCLISVNDFDCLYKLKDYFTFDYIAASGL